MWFGASADWGLPLSTWEPLERSASSSSGYSTDSDSTEASGTGEHSAVSCTPSPPLSSSPASPGPLSSRAAADLLACRLKKGQDLPGFVKEPPQAQQRRGGLAEAVRRGFQAHPSATTISPLAGVALSGGKLQEVDVKAVGLGSEDERLEGDWAQSSEAGRAATAKSKAGVACGLLRHTCGLARVDEQQGRERESSSHGEPGGLRQRKRSSLCSDPQGGLVPAKDEAGADRSEAAIEGRDPVQRGGGEVPPETLNPRKTPHVDGPASAGSLPDGGFGSRARGEAEAGVGGPAGACLACKALLEEGLAHGLPGSLWRGQEPIGREQLLLLRRGLEMEGPCDGARTVREQLLPLGEQAGPSPLSSPQPSWQDKVYSFFVRSFSTAWMVGGFAWLIYLGHMPVFGLILTLQVMMTHELFSLAYRSMKPRDKDAFPRFLNWHFVVTAIVYIYGRLLRDNIVSASLGLGLSQPWASAVLLAFVRFHTVVSLGLYLSGLVTFVLSLKPEFYRAQFGQLGWTHLIVILIVAQSSFFAANLFQGLVWFLLPTSLVIWNDCAAYMFGVLLGHTPLIRVSPKKTWEGFLGAAATTTVVAFLLAGWLGRYEALVCPRKDLSFGPLHCSPSPVFQPFALHLPQFLWPLLPPWATVCHVSPFQLHALALGILASTVAPFGGFFASGFKRAFKVKDFGHVIPGHGGVTDRMDCQMIMALVSYVYFVTFIAPQTATPEAILAQFVTLSPEELRHIHARLAVLI